MNTRQAIQPSTTPPVLSLAFSSSRTRFIAGLSDGLRIFRSDNCLTTYSPSTTSPKSPFTGSLAIAGALDDRYIAFVSSGRLKAGRESVVVFWDCVLECEVSRFDFGESILGVRVCGRWMVVVMMERTVVFAHHELAPRQQPSLLLDEESEETGDGETELLRGPNKLHALHTTAANPFALACLRNDMLVLPAQTMGQLHLVPLPTGSKRVLRAHSSNIRCMALSFSGNFLATASEQGTLIRVWDVKTLSQVVEFRRGVEKAVMFGLAFSEGERWLAATSDKGTIHTFDLRPTRSTDTLPSSTPPTTRTDQAHRKTPSYATHRLSSGGEKDSLSGGSSPTTVLTTPAAPSSHHGSIQEYYGLRPPPLTPTSPPPLSTAVTAFKHSSWAPKVLKDVRSVASTPFHMGDEPVYWQGGTAYSWTTAPGGTRKRVRNPMSTLPGDPSGRPPKGVVAFAASNEGREEDEGAVIYVVGGGTEARWEVFDLLGVEGGGWVLERRGFRRFLTRQFVD